MVKAGVGTQTSQSFRTQKARGIFALSENGYNVPDFYVHKIEEFLPQVEESGQVQMFAPKGNLYSLLKRFVRPCPTVPRHGFVDSRPIHSVEEAEKLIDETYAAEPLAELVSMPFIDAKYSAIWTPGKLIIGTGNDGATSGHASRVIPALGRPIRNNSSWSNMMNLATITEAPYIELLWHKPYDYDKEFRTMFVQLRNGPELPDAVDFIAEEIEVTNVVKAEGDLLEWETKVKSFSKGTVVYHPNGSLASHYAVHAVIAKHPVVISFEPKVGDVLKPNTKSFEPDVDKMRAGFLLGCMNDLTYQEAAYAMLVACHSTSIWLGKRDELLGFGMGCAYRLIITASLGEFRHQPGRKQCSSRNAVYTRAWNKILTQGTRTRYIKAMHSFGHDDWPSSFGGGKWLDFAEYAGSIYNALIEGDVKKSLNALNNATHAAHNGGWAFNKFIREEVMTQTAQNPVITMLRCAPLLYEAILSVENETNRNWMKGKKKYGTCIKDEFKALTKEELKEAKADEIEEFDEENERNENYRPRFRRVSGTSTNSVVEMNSISMEEVLGSTYKTYKLGNIVEVQGRILAYNPNIVRFQYKFSNQNDFPKQWFEFDYDAKWDAVDVVSELIKVAPKVTGYTSVFIPYVNFFKVIQGGTVYWKIGDPNGSAYPDKTAWIISEKKLIDKAKALLGIV